MIKVPNDKLIKFFEKMVDEDFHKRIKESFCDQNVPELSYENIIKYYAFYMYNTKQLTFRRERFRSRNQYEKETIEKYSNNLQKLHNKCEYKIDSETILCKQFRSGIHCDDIKAKLAKFPKLTYAAAVRQAIAFENEKVMTYSLNLALSKINTYNLSTKCEFHVWLNKFEYIAGMIEVPDELMLEFFEKMVDNNIHADKLHNKCEYKIDSETILCKQFRSGIRSDDIKAHLARFPNMTYAETVEKAIALENEKVMTYSLNLALSKINTYNSSTESEFHIWLNKFEYIAEMIEVPDELMLEFFEKMVDDGIHTNVKKIYPILCLLNLTYEDTILYYLKYFSPLDVDLHMKRFMCRNQYENETIDRYAKNLLKLLNKCSNKLFKKCNYKTAGERRLCKQFQNGIRSDYIKEKLMKHPSTTFPETIEKAIALEKEKDMIDFINLAQSMIDTYNSSTEKLSYENIISRYIHCIYYTSENTFHRRRFIARNQYEKETIEKYSINLEKLHNKCKYKTYRYHKLCEKFISGIRSDDIKAHLARFPDMSYFEIVEKAIALENEKVMTYSLNLALSKINTYNSSTENMSYFEIVEKAIALENEKVMTYSLNLALSKINTYNSSTEIEFHVWLNKFEYIAEMIEVPEKLMREFFEKMIDNNVHTGVKDSYPILYLLKLTYEDTIPYYLKYFSPLDVDLHMKRFMCRNQYENETIDKYAKNLLKLSNKCSNRGNQDELLLKQFINGISDENIRNSLHNLFGLSFKEMVEKAIKFSEENKINSYVNEALKMINIYNSNNAKEFFSWYNEFENVTNKIDIPNEKIGKLFLKMVHDDVHTLVQKSYPHINFSRLSSNFVINYYVNYFSASDENRLYKDRFKNRDKNEGE
ncbi:hypothetical protein M0804_013296 [Polistes exclamans]|nr:hypothetical protein M0804_013296 [Polistes exclamans]